MRTLLKKHFVLTVLLLLLLLALVAIKLPNTHTYKPVNEPKWGVTFSKKYTQFLGLDWKETYLAILDDLKVTTVRIPVYWDDIEQRRNAIYLNDYKFMLDEAQKRDVEVVLAIGERLPRWPECHAPEWYKELGADEQATALFTMLEVVVKSFVEYENITHWQVENEPLVRWFGECSRPDPERVKKEIEFVRSFDERPILITDSGELGTWRAARGLGGDLLGITTYRVTWNSWLKYIRYPFPPAYYRIRAKLAGVPLNELLSAELQAEPWIPGTKGLTETSLEDQYRSMGIAQFKANINYARALDVKEVYLWGVEWWYWLKVQGVDTIWNEAKILWR